jgi:hypothetical protein
MGRWLAALPEKPDPRRPPKCERYGELLLRAA